MTSSTHLVHRPTTYRTACDDTSDTEFEVAQFVPGKPQILHRDDMILSYTANNYWKTKLTQLRIRINAT